MHMGVRQHNLFIEFDTKSKVPLYTQVYEQVRDHILARTIKEGEKLPSIRDFASSLEVSHATIERAYLQLAVEGFVNNVPRSGYVVNHIDTEYFDRDEIDLHASLEQMRQEVPTDPFIEEVLAGKELKYDFAFTALQPGSFPRKEWLKVLSDTLKAFPDADLVNYSTHFEPDKLQRELARHLHQARGVMCDPMQIMLQSGTEQALSSLVQLLGSDIGKIGHEEPGFEVMTAVAKRFGIPLVSLSIDMPEGRSWGDVLAEEKPKLIFTTPSHQFPTGRIMSLEDRIELLQWAAENDAYIIEDDSCNEYRYNTRAVPSLHSLDKNQRVIYLCNFSKALSPGMRIAYLVLPPELLGRWHQTFTFSWDSVPYVTREALGTFIECGFWASHLRRMVSGNKPRHDALVEAFEREFGDAVTLSGVDSGMHLFVTVHNGMTQAELIDSARREGANVYGTKRYWFNNLAPENQVMVGFSAIALDDIPEGVKALKRAWL